MFVPFQPGVGAADTAEAQAAMAAMTMNFMLADVRDLCQYLYALFCDRAVERP